MGGGGSGGFCNCYLWLLAYDSVCEALNWRRVFSQAPQWCITMSLSPSLRVGFSSRLFIWTSDCCIGCDDVAWATLPSVEQVVESPSHLAQVWNTLSLPFLL